MWKELRSSGAKASLQSTFQVNLPYEFIEFGTMDFNFPDEFTGFGPMDFDFPMNS